MATAAKLDLEGAQVAGTDIAVVVAQNPAIVLVDAGKRDDLYAHIRREVEAFRPETETEKGRKAIASLAFKITRTKTAIDDAGKKLNEEARAKINIVDAARRDARETLDTMAKDVRRPLTEWEAAEEARQLRVTDLFAYFKRIAVVTQEDTIADVEGALAEAEGADISEADLKGRYLEAMQARDGAVGVLREALVRLQREEADRAELARLRAEAAERDRIDAEKRAAEEVERKRVEAARIAEERRAADEKAEAERVERIAKEAEQRARRAAEQAAEVERQRVQREHEAALRDERAKAEAAERARRAEADRIAREDAVRKAEVDRLAAEQAKREADTKHKTAVKRRAKEAIMTCGASEETAQKIVLSIIAGEVPAVTLRY